MPALISLVIYAILSFVIAPIVSYYHQRYSQYLPLGAISAHTLSIRDRIGDTIMRIALPVWWRNRTQQQQMEDDAVDNDSIFDEEGELMVGMNVDAQRREALERRHAAPAGSEARLSRDIEEGFMDDSDDDVEARGGRRVHH